MPIDEKTRSELLQREIDEADIRIPAEVVKQIAERTVGDGRRAARHRENVWSRSHLKPAEGLTWDQCWNAVYDLVQATQAGGAFGRHRACGLRSLWTGAYQPAIVEQDTHYCLSLVMLAMFLARKYTPAAYKEIGDYFGNRRHSTVISAEKTVEEWLRDKQFNG